VSEDYLATGSAGTPGDFSLVEAEIALRLDDVETARKLYEEMMSRATTASERSAADEGLGQVALRRGDPRAAIKLFEQALVTSGEDECDRPALAESLGRAYSLVGELEPCIAIFERCLEAFEEMDDTVQTVRFACLLGYALADNGDLAGAEAAVAKALVLAQDSVDLYTRAKLYWSKARLRIVQGDAEAASRYAYQALAALELTEDIRHTGMAHQLIAHIEIERGRPEEALAHLEEGWPLLERTGTPIERAQFLLEESRALARVGQREKAAQVANRVSDLLANAEPAQKGLVYVVLAEISADVGESERACELYELAAEFLERNAGPNRYLVDVYAKLADLLEQSGRKEEAYAYMKKAVGMQQTLTRGKSRV
jgi:tetratricopeptide (TPR) repeat protein